TIPLGAAPGDDGRACHLRSRAPCLAGDGALPGRLSLNETVVGPASMARPDSRTLEAPRPVEMVTGFHRYAEGSVLYRAGSTVVLCTASVDNKVPAFLEGKGKGWLTAEYQMHPRANPAR